MDYKKEYYIWAYATSILGKDGIPSLLVENSLACIEDYANLILQSVIPDTKIEFSTTREVSTKETNCSICGAMFGNDSKCAQCGYGFKKNKIKDEINLKILRDNNEINFSLDSGGRKVLISLAVRLALTKLLGEKYKKCELLILDEIFCNLDAKNRESVCKVLFSTLKSVFGFRQILLISHMPLENEDNYQKVTILRKNDYSEILS